MTTYRYNAGNRPRYADVLLLGDSLIGLGVIEDELAAALHLKEEGGLQPGHGGRRSLGHRASHQRLDPPPRRGARVAVVQIDRA